MTTEDSLNALLDADPDDWQTRLVLADWLEENGAPEWAAGYRALGTLRIVPFTFTSKKTKLWCYHNGTGINPDTRTKPRTVSYRHVLPPAWFRACFVAEAEAERTVWVFAPQTDFLRPWGSERRALEERAVVAWGRLDPARQTGLLRAGTSLLETLSRQGKL